MRDSVIAIIGIIGILVVIGVGVSYVQADDVDDTEPEVPDTDVPVTEEVINKQMNIRGLTDGEVTCYKGIPYAEAPVGDLRFAPPVPKAQWTETLDCTKFGHSSVQLPIVPPGIDMDCLYLNVWAPADAKAGDNLPVYVWIHGGAYIIGSGSQPLYDGTEFAKDGIVTVTINYRLGMEGYLNLQVLKDEYGSAGNFGTLDQVLALKWVHDNISAFGGDNGHVTIGGESAGGASVFNLLMCKEAGGLFQQAIMESGSIDCGFMPMIASDDQKSLASFRSLLSTLGLEDSEEGLAELREMDPLFLWNLASISASELIDKPYFYMPVFDGKVLPKEPIRALKEGDYNKDVKVIIGNNGREGDLFDGNTLTSMDVGKYLYRNWEGDDARAIMELYKGDHRLPNEKTSEVIALTLFMVPAAIVQNELADDGETVYAYEFEYRGSNEVEPIHMSELAYVFGNLGKMNSNTTETDRLVMDQAHSMWVNFIINGDPNVGLELPSDVVWEKYDTDTRGAFHFNAEFTFGDKTLADKVDFCVPHYHMCG